MDLLAVVLQAELLDHKKLYYDKYSACGGALKFSWYRNDYLDVRTTASGGFETVHCEVHDVSMSRCMVFGGELIIDPARLISDCRTNGPCRMRLIAHFAVTGDRSTAHARYVFSPREGSSVKFRRAAQFQPRNLNVHVYSPLCSVACVCMCTLK